MCSDQQAGTHFLMIANARQTHLFSVKWLAIACAVVEMWTLSLSLSLSPLAGAQEDVAAEHKAEASADWSEQEGHL